MLKLIFVFLFFQVSYARHHEMPKSFSYQSSQAVFVDFKSANYKIIYDLPQKKASVKAKIHFTSFENGHPIFDSVETPNAITLDGEKVSANIVVTPNKETSLRVLTQAVLAGDHVLEIELPLVSLVEFKNNRVRSAFWTSDLDDREFLERYLPANLEYDQVKMDFDIQFIGLEVEQNIYTNGVVKKINSSEFHISYPDYFTSSSVFFHTLPKESVEEVTFSLRSIDGRDIPVVIYSYGGMVASYNLSKFKSRATDVFRELESDYGAWPHPQLIIYNAGSGGMEYCGATMTDLWALAHEMFHSYFARAVMPANGNSGWVDEALASWRDGGYKRISVLIGQSQMSNHPYYSRKTDDAAYTFGARFMGYLDEKLSTSGGLKPFMRLLVDKHKFSPLKIEEIIQLMNNFSGVNVRDDFIKYTFGSSSSFKLDEKSSRVHRKMNQKELAKFL